MKTKSQVSRRLINMMVEFYGDIETARSAYRTVSKQMREQKPEGFRIIVMTGRQAGRLGIIDARGNQLTPLEWLYVLP